MAAGRQDYHHGNLQRALLDAGLELTRTGGPSALVLRDATRRIGVSPNAAYRHFTDREALLQAVATEIQQNMAGRMQAYEAAAAADSELTGRERLRAVGLGYIEFALTESGWFEVAFADIRPVDPESDRALPAPLQRLVTALDSLADSSELGPDARDGAEWPCWSAVHGFATLALHGPLRGQPIEQIWPAAERTVDTIIAGLLDS